MGPDDGIQSGEWWSALRVAANGHLDQTIWRQWHPHRSCQAMTCPTRVPIKYVTAMAARPPVVTRAMARVRLA